jgi:hypothetical protein
MSKTVLKINQSTACHQLAHYGELKDEKESNSELSLVLFAFMQDSLHYPYNQLNNN